MESLYEINSGKSRWGMSQEGGRERDGEKKIWGERGRATQL